MKTLLAILAAMVLLSCDGGECGQEVAGADECWPGPGLCWFPSANANELGVCCNDSCGCSLSMRAPHPGVISVFLPSSYGCIDLELKGGYSCDADCVCTYPPEDSGVIIELPQ